MTTTARLAVIATLTACGGTPTHLVEPPVDWAQPPAIPALADFVAPQIEHFALANGIQVRLVENRRLPLVALCVVNLAAGSRADDHWDGLAALTADLLDEGAGTRDRPAFMAALEHAGARLDIDIATDAATLQLQLLSSHLDEGVALVADALLRPRFDERDVKRLRTERALRMLEHRANARTAAAQRFDAIAFADHPYSQPAEGDPTRTAFLDVEHIRAFHARTYSPATTAIVVAGDVDRASLERALAPLASWRADEHAATPTLPAVPPLAHARLAMIHRPEATTAVIVAGTVGQPAGAPDRIAAELANTAFGGAPTARLDRRFHDELKLSLAASSSFWRGIAGGSWAIATTVQVEDAHAAITELRAQLAAIATSGFTAAELAAARLQLLRALPKPFETDLGTVRALARLATQQLPDDYYATFAARLARVTPTDAQRALAPFAAAPLVIVVVGDRHVLEPQLADLAAAPGFGPWEF